VLRLIKTLLSASKFVRDREFKQAKWLPGLSLFLHRVGEFKDDAGDGQDHVDKMGVLVAFKVDAAAGGFVGRDRNGRQMVFGGSFLGFFLRSFFFSRD
jgi:hypothetical protein